MDLIELVADIIIAGTVLSGVALIAIGVLLVKTHNNWRDKE